MQEHYLLIVEKREKLKVFFMCLGEDLERKIERIYLEECSENPRTVILFYFI